MNTLFIPLLLMLVLLFVIKKYVGYSNTSRKLSTHDTIQKQNKTSIFSQQEFSYVIYYRLDYINGFFVHLNVLEWGNLIMRFLIRTSASTLCINNNEPQLIIYREYIFVDQIY